MQKMQQNHDGLPVTKAIIAVIFFPKRLWLAAQRNKSFPIQALWLEGLDWLTTP
jgi:hypothetical protein